MSIPVGVLGSGSFGTCLAILCARHGDVTLWSRNEGVVDAINARHRNPNHLRDVDIPDAVIATGDIERVVANKELVICAVPSHAVREVMQRAAPFLSEGSILVSAVKGIEYETGMTMHQVIRDVLPEHAFQDRLSRKKSRTTRQQSSRSRVKTKPTRFQFKPRSHVRGFAVIRAPMSPESNSAGPSRTSSRSRWGWATARARATTRGPPS